MISLVQVVNTHLLIFAGLGPFRINNLKWIVSRNGLLVFVDTHGQTLAAAGFRTKIGIFLDGAPCNKSSVEMCLHNFCYMGTVGKEIG
jgi:hypothetical protein